MRLFCTHTPYHLILSLMIAASSESLEDTVIIIISDWEVPKNLIEKLNSVVKICILPGCYGVIGTIEARAIMARNTFKLRRIVKKLQISDCYVFADNRAEDQLAAHITKNVFRGIVHYVEDGLSAYCDYEYKQRGKLGKLVSRFLYGGFFESIERHGLFRLNDDAYFLFPDLVTDSLVSRYNGRLRNVPKNSHLLYTIYSQELRETTEEFGSCKDISIYFLPHSSAVDDSVKRRYVRSMKQTSMNSRVIFKYHPREDSFYLNHFGLRSVRKEIPSEIVVLAAYQKLKDGLNFSVYSDTSTALMTTRFFVGNNCSTFSLRTPKSSILIDKLSRVFESINIQVI